MGGLVAHNFIRLHREIWEQMRQGNQSRGGRLIMLGTPNFGSFAIPQALTGVESLVRLLAAADVQHNLSELLAVLNSFVGTYELLPAPSKLPIPAQAIYRQQTARAIGADGMRWRRSIGEKHLSTAVEAIARRCTQGQASTDEVRIAEEAVMLAGMGEAGRFTRNDLRDLMTNVPYAIATLGIDRYASVLIGSGAGNLPRESALRAMLNGIVAALKRLETGERLQQVTLIKNLKATGIQG
jgi:hypothetical protein